MAVSKFTASCHEANLDLVQGENTVEHGIPEETIFPSPAPGLLSPPEKI
jgi:hypothetical protein